jgi:hypothetical protein
MRLRVKKRGRVERKKVSSTARKLGKLIKAAFRG